MRPLRSQYTWVYHPYGDIPKHKKYSQLPYFAVSKEEENSRESRKLYSLSTWVRQLTGFLHLTRDRGG